MTKENAHLYLPLVQALADGKTIEMRSSSRDNVWVEWETVGWGNPPNYYRIKPEPKTVPLGPEDVPPGSVFRPVSFKENEYYNPLHVGMHMISLADTVLFTRKWAQMHEDGWLIKRPGQDWQPCSKQASE